MSFQPAVFSPCIGICRLDPSGHCEGCHRTGSEIAAWLSFDDAMRLRYMDEILPARAAAHLPHRQADVADFQRALLALSSVPEGPAWNRAEHADLLPDGTALAPAAVLVGLVSREAGWQVMLTLRTEDLRTHAGQVSFPGGRIEAGDDDVLGAALRETQEEIGIAPSHIQPLGFLPDQIVLTGFRITPVVGLVRPDFELRVDSAEVAEVFEVPLEYLLAENFRPTRRVLRGLELTLHDLHFEGRVIWGATAGMLQMLRAALLAEP